jgi:hypothetical protein
VLLNDDLVLTCEPGNPTTSTTSRMNAVALPEPFDKLLTIPYTPISHLRLAIARQVFVSANR